MPIGTPDSSAQACSTQAKANVFSSLMVQKSFGLEASVEGKKSEVEHWMWVEHSTIPKPHVGTGTTWTPPPANRLLEGHQHCWGPPYQEGSHWQSPTGFQLLLPVAVADLFYLYQEPPMGLVDRIWPLWLQSGLGLRSDDRGTAKGLRPGSFCMGGAVLGTLRGRWQWQFLMHGSNSAWSIISLFSQALY